MSKVSMTTERRDRAIEILQHSGFTVDYVQRNQWLVARATSLSSYTGEGTIYSDEELISLVSTLHEQVKQERNSSLSLPA